MLISFNNTHFIIQAYIFPFSQFCVILILRLQISCRFYNYVYKKLLFSNRRFCDTGLYITDFMQCFDGFCL